jgi:glucose/arabinose dehydrogenase
MALSRRLALSDPSARRWAHHVARIALAWVCGAAWLAPRAWSQLVVPTGFENRPALAGLDFPSGMAFLPDGRLLVIEQRTAIVRLAIVGTVTTASPIFTVPEVNPSGGEQGLLGVAVDPGWPSRSYVYFLYDHDGDATIHIARFQVTGDLDYSGAGDLAISASSRYDVLVDAPDNAPNHNGGTLRFGPDGMLYASLGEDANRCAAQDSVSLRGVILRLDVSRLPDLPGGPAPKGLIAAAGNPFAAHPDSNARLVWSLGLRNPFRFHVDMSTGDLFIADVGEVTWEEVNVADGGGLNFGWPHREGPATFPQGCTDTNAGFTDPIHAYDRSGFAAAIISAGPYRAPAGGSEAFPAPYDGDFFFNDYYQGFVRRLTRNGSTWGLAPMVSGQPGSLNWGIGFGQVSDWVVGPSGALWYCRQSNGSFQAGTGVIGRIAYAPAGGVTVPPSVRLHPPFPSPAIGSVAIPYTLPDPAAVSLRLYDAHGRLVRTLLAGEPRQAGPGVEPWDGRSDGGDDAPAGVYVVRLEVGGVRLERRFPLIR